ncbi:hypothetical protein Tco_0394318 [Tanacetum coccineum]
MGRWLSGISGVRLCCGGVVGVDGWWSFGDGCGAVAGIGGGLGFRSNWRQTGLGFRVVGLELHGEAGCVMVVGGVGLAWGYGGVPRVWEGVRGWGRFSGSAVGVWLDLNNVGGGAGGGLWVLGGNIEPPIVILCTCQRHTALQTSDAIESLERSISRILSCARSSNPLAARSNL